MKALFRSRKTILISCLLALLFFGFSTAGKTIQICKIGCELNSLKGALKRSDSGDTIKVRNGRYSENLRVDKNITIVGTNSRWVNLTPTEGNAPVMVVGPSPVSVELRNLTLNPGKSSRAMGIKLTGDARLIIKDSRFAGGQLGIRAENSSYLKLRDVELDRLTTGILATQKSKTTVFESSLTSARSGLVAEDSSELNFINSEVTGCRHNSVLARDSAKVNILDSDISNNAAPGIELKDFSRLTAKESQISNNRGGGVLLSDSAQADLHKNRIAYNEDKNVAVISKKCGFSGPMEGFFGEIKGANNDILPGNSKTICPGKFSRITTAEGGTSSYQFTPSTYAFIGLIGAATVVFLFTR